MKKFLYILLISCFSFIFIISCGEKEEVALSDDDYSDWEKSGNYEGILISSSISDNATVTFGQSYQYQVTTTSAYTGTVTYSLSNHPDGMSISSSGLVEWTPAKGSQITTHSNIKITLTNTRGYVLTQSFNLTVSGTCVSGNVFSIWSGDQRSSTNSSKFLGNITAYSDNSSNTCGNGDQDCTASNNYYYHNDAEDLMHGPTPSATKGNLFFYNQYDNTSYTYLFWMFGKGGSSFSPSPNSADLDLFVFNNESSDNVVVTDDSGETSRVSQTSSAPDSSTYTGRYQYNSNKSDGGVIGPFSGRNYRIYIEISGTSSINSENLSLGNLDSFTYWSRDQSSVVLEALENFTVGYNTTIDCSN